MKRFWDKVIKSADGCWEWQGATASGYGQIRIDGYLIYAHRFSYQMFYDDPAGLVVRHTCDNRLCVNPNHLVLGTHADNMADMVAKGRSKKGEDCARSKLTEAKVLAMRGAYEDGGSYRSLADEYGIDYTTVAQIVKRKTWRHL